MFEQATGELRATLLGNHSGISNGRTHRLERARRSGGPGCGADTRHQESPRPNFARNLTRSFFKIGHKRCNSNDTNSTFEQATGELRATLLGNHPDQRGGRTHRQAAPVTSRYTRYVALHPLRRAAPVTRRNTRSEGVHCLRIGCSTPSHKNKRGSCETRTWVRCRWVAAGPGRASRRRAERSSQRGRLAGGPPPTGTPSSPAHTNKQHGTQKSGAATSIATSTPQRGEAATGFPATASARSISATQRHSAPLSAAQPNGTAEQAPPIRRSCPRDPRPRRGRPRGGRRGHGTGSRTRSPGPRRGRSGSTAGRHRARHTRRA